MTDVFTHPTTGARVCIPTDMDCENWPKEFGTDKKIAPCKDCDHPMSYHAMALRNGKIWYECLCGCNQEGT